MTGAGPDGARREVRIAPAAGPGGLAEVARLLREYAGSADFPPGGEPAGVEAELADLPGRYGPPGGRLMLAEVDGRAAGCVALHTFAPGACELKRLFVRPAFRNAGIGRGLLLAAVAEARAMGFDRVILEAAPFLTAAAALYRSLGFREVPRYWDGPHPDDIPFALTLDPPADGDEAPHGR